MANEIMNANEIKSYLSSALKLELELRSMKETQSQWTNRIRSLGIPADLKEPKRGIALIDATDTAFLKGAFYGLLGAVFNPITLIGALVLGIQKEYGVFKIGLLVILGNCFDLGYLQSL